MSFDYISWDWYTEVVNISVFHATSISYNNTDLVPKSTCILHSKAVGLQWLSLLLMLPRAIITSYWVSGTKYTMLCRYTILYQVRLPSPFYLHGPPSCCPGRVTYHQCPHTPIAAASSASSPTTLTIHCHHRSHMQPSSWLVALAVLAPPTAYPTTTWTF